MLEIQTIFKNMQTSIFLSFNKLKTTLNGHRFWDFPFQQYLTSLLLTNSYANNRKIE